MTNKSLSQRLCEACGIEPEIIEDYDSNEYEFYPDFENNNNNFVKLMELEIPYKNNKTITLFNISEYYVVQYMPRNKIDFLICLLTFLTNSDNNKSKMAKIKAIIKQTDWEV